MDRLSSCGITLRSLDTTWSGHVSILLKPKTAGKRSWLCRAFASTSSSISPLRTVSLDHDVIHPKERRAEYKPLKGIQKKIDRDNSEYAKKIFAALPSLFFTVRNKCAGLHYPIIFFPTYFWRTSGTSIFPCFVW
jgi:hypothetical protein